tara:strand:- start:4401 stop:6782 length:2382 start_codon:yes stop_codon:yes gene_type:complete
MLITSTTNFNKLKFKSQTVGDRWDGGKSGQPYIVKPIPGADDTFLQQLDGTPQPKGGVDFLLRGGLLSVDAASDDVSRLTKLLFDTKSPNGFEFIAKQNVLSRNSVKTESTFGLGYGFGALNQGVYAAVGTLGQAAIDPVATGATNLFGVNPFTDNTALSINNNVAIRTGSGGMNGYYGVVNAQNNLSNDATTNRLYRLLDGVLTGTQQSTVGGKITLNPDGTNTNILEYGGGPNSILGIGKTRIPFADQRTGHQNPSLIAKEFFNNPTFTQRPLNNPNYVPSFGDYSIFKRKNVNIPNSDIFLGVIGSKGMAQAGSNNLFNTFIDNTNDVNDLISAEFDNPNKFAPNLTDKVVIDNSPAKTANFKKIDGPNDYNALNSSSPTLTKGIYGGENTENSKITKGNIFVVGASKQFNELFPGQSLFELNKQYLAVNVKDSKYIDQSDGVITNDFSVYNSGLKSNKPIIEVQNTATLTQEQLYQRPIASQTGLTNVSDFRVKTSLGDITSLKSSTVLSLSPNYIEQNENIRTNQGDPGQTAGQVIGNLLQNPKNVLKYGVDAKTLIALDKINAMPLYDASAPDYTKAIKDSVNFNIAVINNNNSGKTNTYIHFRALLNDFSDSYTAKWDAVQYVGRGEELYNYKGFGREISMGWTVYAQSKAELIPMYKKLNYLASTLAPDYNNAGFMRGNIVKMTVGGYLYDQPGIIKSINYGISEESPWEIAIDEEGNEDTSVKQLPHMIKVTGVTFVPIQKFIPSKANSLINPDQKYIALANSTGTTNYSDEYSTGYQQGSAII